MHSISSILRNSFTLHANSPLSVEKTSSSSEHHILTYAHAQFYIELYQEWITHTIIQVDNIIHSFHHLNQTQIESKSYLTLAFLGYNSLDYLLAVLASLNCGGRTTNICLLNIRWTSSEIANTLRVPCTCTSCSPWLVHSTTGTTTTTTKKDEINNDDFSSMRQIITIILYTPSKKDVAHDAKIKLSSFPCNNHRVFIYPLPHLGDSHPLPSSSSYNKHILTCHQKSTHPLPSQSMIDYLHMSPNQISPRTAIIFFTSGTTSTSKGCCLSHRSLFIQAYAKTKDPCGYNMNSRLYATPLPFFHIGGFSSALAILLVGGTLVFTHDDDNKTQPSYSFVPTQMISAITSSRTVAPVSCNDEIDYTQSDTALVNTLVVVPAILHGLFTSLQHSTSSSLSLSLFTSIRLILVGAQSLTQHQLNQCHYYFPQARIIQTYACTEAGSSITFVDLTHVQTLPVGILGSFFVGNPPKHIEIQIIQHNIDNDDDDDNNNSRRNRESIHSPFHVGLISTRGPHVLNQYWCRKDLSSSSIQEETMNSSWFVTNDLGYLTDQGGLYYCGRSDDVIRTGGESVLAMEVEMILIQHPMIDTVVVFPLADEKFGYVVCAAITTTKQVHDYPPNVSWNTSKVGIITLSGFKEIREFCTKHHLAKYKHPKKIFILPDFPRNSSGKILKQELIHICSAVDTATFENGLSKL